MINFPRPNIVVSKCLGFAKCRYNGDTVLDYVVDQLKPYVNYTMVCPEVEIGLGIPRDPIRIVSEKNKLYLYQPATKKDITEKMVSFVDKHLSSLQDIDGFILKYRSPSCGINSVKIYNSYNPDARSSAGAGFFGGEVAKRFSGLAIEDEGRLKNFSIREYFFTKLFVLTQFRLTKKQRQMRELVKFHTVNKLLFMAHNQTKMRELGKIVANQEKLNIDMVLNKYESTLYELLAKAPLFASWINVLTHAFGGMTENLSKEERKFFLNMIEEYRDERIPLSVLTKLVLSWAVRFNNEYLLEQSFLNPYPKDLIEITDSGKGRNR
ncbi:MAG: DUF523 and DUF1722 domain-containing protein [Candidatus Latescibacteria bacterium]|nr:DUF523 and DUF1722 domain-containing protein [Candidatus Latescibacterota bacterium]